MNSEYKLKQFFSGIYHAVPAGEASWYSLARFAVQAALDAGIELKARPESIKPILAIEYPLPAPRPMNSRLDNTKLRRALQNKGLSAPNSYNEMEKLPDYPAWDDMVQEYVSELASKGLIK